MRAWLQHPAAHALVWDMKENQLATMMGLICADADDPAVIIALRIAQGAQLTINYIEERVAEAHRPLVKEEDPDGRSA